MSATRRRLARLQRRLTLTWSVAWILGIGVLTLVAIQLSARLRDQDLDGRLALTATATYGLTWFEAGRLQDEVFRREPGLTDEFDVWVIDAAAEGAPVVHLGPEEARFEAGGLARHAARVQETEERLFVDVAGADGRPLRVHAVPTYAEYAPRVRAAILVVGDRREVRSAQRAFVTRVVAFALLLGLAGVGLGAFLARISLSPLARSLEQRERFLAAAAHELRSPIASLRGVCESSSAGDEPPQRALERVHALVERAAGAVDQLLLYARLHDGSTVLEPSDARLDLIAEAALPAGARVELDLEPAIARVDGRLVEVAVRVLVENALRHAGAGSSVRVLVRGTRIEVADEGPGFPPEVLGASGTSFVPSRGGVGLGIAIARLVAELHGGGLSLANEGGGRARLDLAPPPGAGS